MNTFELINFASTSANLRNADFRVLGCLISYNGRGKIFVSLETISEATGIKGLSRISTIVNRLERYGYVMIRRRKHLNNFYSLCEDYKTKDKSRKTDMKKTKEPRPKTIGPEKEKPFINDINAGIVGAAATITAKLHGYDKPESGHYAFVNKIVKAKEKDKYSDDDFNTVRRFLILLYLLNLYSDKIKPGEELPFGYFNAVYSSQIYGITRSKIFKQPISRNEFQYL